MLSSDPDFGAWLKARRKDRGWTQDELAKQITDAGWAVSRNWINRVEAGAKASSDFHDAAEKLLGRYNPPIPAERTAAADRGDVAAAIRDQTEVLRLGLASILQALTTRPALTADLEELEHYLAAVRASQRGTERPRPDDPDAHTDASTREPVGPAANGTEQ